MSTSQLDPVVSSANPWYPVARDLWAFIYGENVPRVLARLQQLHDDQQAEFERPGSDADPPAPLPSRRTVYDWVAKDNWTAWRDRTFRIVLPGMHAQNLVALAAGVHEAFDTVRALARHEHIPGESALQERNSLQAALALLDRAGYSPRDRAAGEKRPNLAEIAAGIDLSPEAIAALIQGSLDGSQTIDVPELAGYIDTESVSSGGH